MDKCKEVKNNILEEVKKEIEQLNCEPKLAVINCSHDKNSEIYIRNKLKTANEVGIKADLIKLDPDETDINRLISIILECNVKYNGTILQLPLDDKFKGKENMLLNLIEEQHDVDGLGDKQKLKLINNDKDALIPATAYACFKIMEHELKTTDLSGKRVCIISRSDLIGKPLMNLLLNHNATPTICHSKTSKDINNYLFNNGFDFIITGIGKHIINENFLAFTTIIDCGLSRDENGKLLRDVIRKYHENNIYYGAVGTITCASICYNTLKAYKLQKDIE